MIRAPAPAPPEGKKRRHMPLAVRLEAALLALGLDPKTVEWDHRPPLSSRIWDPEAGDYDPPENDPRYIRPISKAEHREISARVDTPAAAKIKRLSKEQEAFRLRMLAKGEPEQEEKSRPKSRKFPKGRGFPKRKKEKKPWTATNSP